MSDSLRSLKVNEQMSDSLKKFWLNKFKFLFFSMFYKGFFIKKISNLLIPSFLVKDVSESFRSLTKNERCVESLRFSPKMSDHERFAQVAQRK